MKQRYVVAVKVATPGTSPLKQGRVLGEFRELEYAQKAKSMLHHKHVPHLRYWEVGIFLNGKCVE